MYNRLWVRLTLAFGLVIALAVATTVLLTRQGAAAGFAHFMVDHHMVRPEPLTAALAEHYRTAGSWVGLDERLPLVVEVASDGAMADMVGGMFGMQENRVQVLDAAGRVVAASAGGAALSGPAVQSYPIAVDERAVGTLLVEGGMMVGAPTPDTTLLAAVTRAAVTAGLASALAALLLALLLVRLLTQPLERLSSAAQRIAAGDLTARMPPAGSAEFAALAATFNQMAGALQEQEETRRRSAADIAHELRTPLSAIQATVEGMQDGVLPVDAESLDALHGQALQLNRLVEDLRTLAHTEAGQLTLRRDKLDLVDLCVRQAAALRPHAVAHGVTLAVNAPAGALYVAGDAQRLSQVLANLLDNALHYAPQGGRVEMSVARQGGAARICVVDDGPGVAVEDLPHIFDRFYRAGAARSRRSGGAGLGLAIARGIVQAHGGTLWVESPPRGVACGAAFVLDLPLY